MSTIRHSQLATSANPRVVEVLVEKPVIVKKYVDIEVDQFVDNPVPHNVYKDIYIDKVVEIPITKERIVNVEKLKYVNKEFITEKEVRTRRYVEKPYEVIQERPYEVIKEQIVNVPNYVDKHVEILKVKPIQHQQIVETITHDIPIEIDIFTETQTKVEVPVYMDEVYQTIRDIPVTEEVPVSIEIDLFTEQHQTEIRERIVEVPVKKYVEKEHIINEYQDEPYDVINTVTKEVVVPVEKKVYVDVERRVNIPIEIDLFSEKEVKNEIIVEQPVNFDIRKANFSTVEVQLPEVANVPITHEVPVYKEIPTEKVPLKFNKLVGLRKCSLPSRTHCRKRCRH